MEKKLEELKILLKEVSDLNGAAAVLGWDQSTYMPAGGAETRGRQMSTLAKISQEKFTDPAVGKLLDDLQKYAESLPYDSDDASFIRVARRDYERAIKIPPEFISRLMVHQAASFEAWKNARPENNFKKVQPLLEKTVEMSREVAEFFAPYDHIADPLIDNADFGMRAATVRKLFADLRAKQVPIVKAITSQKGPDVAFMTELFPRDKQMEFSREVVKQLGYDYNRGRDDISHHPFTTNFSQNDVRITTRVNEHDLGDCLFSMIHESGHAMYEQGVNPAYEGTPLAGGTSSGVHESQSRLWENLVGRSRGFWEYFYPNLQKTFPHLKKVSLEDFYRAINEVKCSLIRTDADEVTYNLHVMLRFEFELQLLEDKLKVKDLPDAWHAGYQSDLGLRAPDDRDGVLQDVHWYAGIVGGSFQGYTLGNVMGAQFFQAALKEHPEIPAEIKQGKLGTLHSWLIENIYKYGRKFTAPELVKRITGSEISIEPYVQYLRSKYGELYKL